MKAKGAAQLGRGEVGSETGSAPLKAAAGGEIANRHRIAARVSDQLLGDLHRFQIVARQRHAQPIASTSGGGFDRRGVHGAERPHKSNAR